MNTLNVFKLYYIAWHQKNETREYTELGCLKNNLNHYENILLKSDINEYISNYNYSTYLNIWEKVCTKKKEYFLAKINENMSNIVEDTSNILFYLSSQDISDYYIYTGADFNLNGENLEPSTTKTYKNLLLIARKLDLQLYNNQDLCSSIQ
jgi:DNA polymerase III delta prime subunit